MIRVLIVLSCVFFFSVQKLSGQITFDTTITNTIYSPSLHYQYEEGVANRFSLQNVAVFYKKSCVFSAGWRFYLNEQVGLGSLHFAINELFTSLPWLSFGAELAHHEYPDYNMGENQLALLSYFKTKSKKLRFGVGLTYRAPLFDDKKLHSPFKWGGDLNEFYFIAQLKWSILHKNKYFLGAKMGTYDFMQIQTLDHIFLKLEQIYSIKPKIHIYLNVSTAVKGISGFLFGRKNG